MAINIRFKSFCFCCSIKVGTVLIAMAGLLSILLINAKYSFLSTIALTSFVVHGSLLFGTLKKKKSFVVPWLFFFATLLVGMMIITIAILIIQFLRVPTNLEEYQHNTYFILSIILIILCLVLGPYLWLVVWSYYTFLVEETIPIPPTANEIEITNAE